mmetsp:Transcript_13033/g.31937  ORF Transcript_13033/g.31937 Transcript_13033/m.31937 type:complete len:268 (-) Transcript_13033:293-1096(-)
MVETIFLPGVKIAAVVTAVAMNLSPVDDVLAFRRQGNTGDKHPLPYAMILVNSSLWLMYGVLKGDYFPMVFTNFVGVLAGLFHVCAFLYYSTGKLANKSKFDGKPYVALVVLSVMLGLSLIYANGHEGALSQLGTVAIVAMIGLFGSPLVMMQEVIKKKDSSALSRPLSTLSLLCSASWTTYGILEGDVFVWGPNSLAVALAIGQVSLIVLYPATSKATKAAEGKRGSPEKSPVRVELGEIVSDGSLKPDSIQMVTSTLKKLGIVNR